MRHIFLLLLNRCLCIFNSLSCPSCLSLNIILNPFLFFFIAEEVCFASVLCRKLLFDLKLRNAPWARIFSASKLLLPSFA
jgi:hypothetical protein